MLRLPSSSIFLACPVHGLPGAMARVRPLGVPVSCVASPPVPWLIVGIGNPGSKFVGTRHNVGFDMIDAVAAAESIKLSAIQHKCLVGKGYIDDTPVLLAKPQTYVNLSGEAVGPLASYYRIPVERVLVIVDDLNLDFAVMRLLPKGGHGGHNGMRNLVQHFRGSTLFPRLRIGIGRPPASMDCKAFVLQKFSGREREMLDLSFHRGVEAVRLVTTQGLDKAVSTWDENRRSKTPTMET